MQVIDDCIRDAPKWAPARQLRDKIREKAK